MIKFVGDGLLGDFNPNLLFYGTNLFDGYVHCSFLPANGRERTGHSRWSRWALDIITRNNTETDVINKKGANISAEYDITGYKKPIPLF
jgi:hypothetical protein